MKTPSIFSVLAAGVLVSAAFTPARAVELQQKFVAGQSLNYNVSMSGTANVKVPADLPVFFAGVPLEIEINGQGLARLNTLEVNPAGDGTVYLELPKLDLNGETFGQKALLELRDGKPRFLLNGKPLAVPLPDPNKQTGGKAYGLVIGKEGRVKSVKELSKDGQLLPTQATNAQSKPAADEVAPADAVDKGAFISSLILRALPTLWPQGDVQPGDTWKTTLPLPAALARTPETAQTAAPLSQWTMTLKGQEVVDGVSLWRVGIVGGIEVDGGDLPAPAAPKKGAKAVPALENLSQKVDGDLWFDAAKGQIVRGDMVIDARVQSHTIGENGRNSEPSWADFTGTFGLRLQP